MTSRPKEELERTQVTKTEEEKERGRPSPSTELVKETIHAGAEKNRREGAKREWGRGQSPNT